MLRSTQLEQEICAANKDQYMAKIKLKFTSVKVFTRGKITRQLWVLYDLVKSIFLSNYANFFSWIDFLTGLQRGREVIFMSVANLNWVQNFIKRVVDANYLNVLNAR